MWNDPRLGVETKVNRVLDLHLLQALGELTLLGHTTHRREVIDSLEAFELAELLRRNGNIIPNDINIRMSLKLLSLVLLRCLRLSCGLLM